MAKEFAVHVINPRKRTSKKTTKKKASRRRRRPAKRKTNTSTPQRKTNMAARKKRTTRRRAPARRRAANPAPARRRRKNPSSYRRTTRRRKNPGETGAVFSEMKSAIPRMLGMMATAWAVRRWGGQGGLFGTQHTSPMMGQSWSFAQYAIAGAVAAFGPRLLGKWINPSEFRRGAVDLMVQKFIWTEGLARNQWAQQQFGQDIAMGPQNQLYYDQGGQWNAMQGLVEASPLDGLVEASPLDGDLNYQDGKLQNTPHKRL